MSKRRSNEEWQQLIAEFEAGSESGKAFCLRHALSSSNFYKQRSRYVSASPSSFVSARRVAPSTSLVTVQVNDIVIRCDMQTPVTWVCDLVAALRG